MPAENKTSLLALVLFLVCLAALQYAVTALEFDRQQILAGQVWRLWTAHCVHSHLIHLTLNSIAAAALYLIVLNRLNRLELLCSGFVFAGLLSSALLFFYPNLSWYNGLSGLLHALVSYACVRLSVTHSRLYVLGLTAVWIKIVFEALRMQVGIQDQLAGMTIITQAHLVGAGIGTLSAIIYLVLSRTLDKSGYKSGKIHP